MKIKLKRIIIIMMLFSLIYPYGIVLAAVDLDTARNAIVSYAVNFQSSHGTEVYYYLPGSFKYRNDAYNSNTKYDPLRFNITPNGKYLLDCVGWTNYCIHNALKLDCGASGSNSMCFAAPPGENGSVNTSREYFDYTPGTEGVKPGDLIISQTHIMVLTGDDEIVHSVSTNGLNKDIWSSSERYKKSNILGYYTLNSKALNEISESDLDYGGNPVGSSSKSVAGSKSSINMSDFYYNGIPDGKYSVTKGVFERVISGIGDVFEFLVTFIVNILRMVFVGWAGIAENLVTFIVKSVAGEDDIEVISSTDVDVDSGDNVTVEKIIFNQISVFDVNFFNYNDLESESEEEFENVEGSEE